MRGLLIVALLLFGCNRESPTELQSPEHPYPMGANGDSTISGIVLSADGRVVPGALVAARMEGADFDHRMMTDGSGSFRIGELIPHGNYDLTVFLSTRPEAVAFLKVTLIAFKDTRVTITLPPLALPPSGCTYVSGHVTDYHTSKPVVGVKISYLGSTTSTDAQGWYSLALGCPPNATPGVYYTMDAAHPDYMPFHPQVKLQPVSFVYDLDMMKPGP